MPFRVDGGIDVLESYIREAIEQKIVERSGAWYTYKDVKAMGMNGIKEKFLASTELLEDLKADVA